MNRKEAKDASKILLEFHNGKTIQYKRKKDKEWKEPSINSTMMAFDFSILDYRVKPEKKCVDLDFSDAEMLLGFIVRLKQNGDLHLITGVGERVVSIANSTFTYSELSEYFEFKDGTPLQKIV